MPHRLTARTIVAAVLLLATLLGTGALVPGAASAREAVEDYAAYQPQTKCAPKAKPGAVVLGEWLVRRHGGGFGPISRDCSPGSTSEHQEGRAFDWMLDATTPEGQAAAQAFFADAFAADAAGNPHARARRMGIMYVIWDDHMYSAWNGFQPERYLSSSCPRRKGCSATLRHRDHVHISLTRAGGKARTSWYDGRVAR